MASREIQISDGAFFIRTDMTPESFNFTKGVQRHVYLSPLERVELCTIRADGIPRREVKIIRRWLRWRGSERATVTKVTIRIYDVPREPDELKEKRVDEY